MEVILREHVDNLGRRGDIVKVADGYARNYLLPRKLALPATDANRQRVDRERKIVEAREVQERESAAAIAARIGAVEIVLARKVGETDTLYGSVTASDIAEALAGHQLEIEKRKIQLAEPIKTLGEFAVPIKLHRDVTASVKVQVVREAEADDEGPEEREER